GCFIVGLIIVGIQSTNPKTHAEFLAISANPEGVSVLDNSLPQEWNEKSIVQQFTQLRADRPSAVPHLLNSVLERFVVGQDEKTVEKRTQFLRTLSEHFKVSKEFATAFDDLKLHRLETDQKAKTLELANLKIDLESRKLTR